MQMYDSSTASDLLRYLEHNRLIFQKIEDIDGAHFIINNKDVISFVSAGYLGLQHHAYVRNFVSAILKKWGISYGIPRLLGSDYLTSRLEKETAYLVRKPKSLIFPSTTHAALDLLPSLARPKGVLYVDERAYPTSMKGVKLSRQKGVRAYYFTHNSSLALERIIKNHPYSGNKLIVCDGVYSPEGVKAPLKDFIEIAEAYDAFIYVDDANGIGILGKRPDKVMPYGYGGRGTPGYFGLNPSKRIIHGGTLSKAFGVPVAFVAAESHVIDYLRNYGDSHIHSSPPSIPNIAAALASLKVHALYGEDLRSRLYHRVRQFKKGLFLTGIRPLYKHLYPIQTLPFFSTNRAKYFAKKLREKMIWSLVQFHPPDYPQGAVVRFVITALHTAKDIDYCLEQIAHVRRLSSGSG